MIHDPPSRRLMLVPPPPPDGALGAPPARPMTLEAAFRQYAPYVGRIGMRILGNDDEIDDLVQDVFARATTGLRRMTDPAEVRGWLATVTVRVAVRRLRARRLRRIFQREDAWFDTEVIAPQAGPEQRSLIRGVYALLDRLPARQRAAWVLRHVEEERLEDVAHRCECSLATAKRLIARAEEWIERNVRDGHA